ncbi:MAG: hypothetical protein MI806_18450 [Minwuiales bacterium]|nr:hypothetical protein [Minwuiales bacterium]
MYSKFKYMSLQLKDIMLDVRNPRIVTQKRLRTQEEIVGYLFEYEDLAAFIKKIISEGRNTGAERPYVVKTGRSYTVVEGNTRIAAYKLLTGLLKAPSAYAGSVPDASKALKDSLLTVDCSIAPDRDALLPIMANSHFGLGDKSKWGYLGSRKAVYDEWKEGKSVAQLAKAFDRTKGQIKELILEYCLYLEALKFKWTKPEKEVLLDPAVEFNPPVRFLQTRGHKGKVGITYDKANLKVVFADVAAEKKFKHLVAKLVINPEPGLGATATYDEVFEDFNARPETGAASGGHGQSGATSSSGTGSGSGSTGAGSGTGSASGSGSSAKPGALFSYPLKINHTVLQQLMKEAKDLSCKRYPAAGTFLLRNIVESLLKHIIHEQNANPTSKSLDLVSSISLCMSNAVKLTNDDKRILKQFQKDHLSYLNLGSHGNVVPNYDRVMAARDCIDQFVKKNI